MKILLIGEYSNVHWTLAEGLRSLGHKVCVASNGDFWKNYKRDISLTRTEGKLGGIALLLKTILTLPKLRGYDVVQLINPMFLELKAERLFPIYNYLRKHNKKVFLCAMGMDTYWVEGCTSTPYIFHYSDFNIGNQPINNAYIEEQKNGWIGTTKAKLNKYIANDCDGIIAGLYEYYAVYKNEHAKKLTYIPFPIKAEQEIKKLHNGKEKIKFFIGINKERNIYKGTDIMLRALERIAHDYPNECEILKAESVPYEEYTKLTDNCDVLLDQLYGYSPAMNALQAMSKGKITVGGAEEECYGILSEKELRPMINVIPDEQDVYEKLKNLIKNKERIAQMQKESAEFIKRHHTPEKVAQEYINFWNSK